ncbi:MULTISPECIES: D-glycerate dehydrogenase [unclassified Sporosarcina]|uniref:2-hydroxyacid dehydrogenase n=1 Tax=unclassified Sporosarcina TaxID=2647733 RepID=UPI002041D349|nr:MULTISPECIES: D-glycerate dehydrogenase [unclassified Sporosarcina]GKV64830.1 bifunctional glyoxylate/hydroxypyruvate reductase B [Sporosarcina sp. NCCP-2331]GLB54940.1 bifunctional glyoxylate/hydroxypyruvate reductase B [Sporosarcina sp. NCCP-2378]
MKPKVFIAKPIPKEVEDYIAKHCEYKIWNGEESVPESELLKEVADVEGLMTPKGVITKEFLTHAPNLKVVSNIAVGYDAFDTDAMKERGVIGTHTPYVLDDSVADLVLGLMLSAGRRIVEFDRYVKEGKWEKTSLDGPEFYGKDIHHATLGIIGLGRIGEKIMKRASAGFDMNVLYHNRSRKPEIENQYGVLYREDMDDLLRESDYVVVMLPLNESTTHIIGKQQFELMKNDAIFINCSRGKVVDEQALISALENHEICAAGLDVFEIEPVEKDNPLLKLKNVVTLPHIGSCTRDTRFNMAMKAAENMVAALTNQTPPNVVRELQDLV